MRVVKLDKKCPDITVRRKPNSEDEYLVKVNGEVIHELEGDNWSRKIYVSKKHGVVIKIDDDYYTQSRNEVVFWSEILDREHKRYFAPVLGWGTTTRKCFRSRVVNGKWTSYKVTARVFFCVQKYIHGAKELERDCKNRELYDEYTFLSENLADRYMISDFDYRQVKVNSKGNLKVHDYGLFGDYDTNNLDSESIPFSANVAAKNMNRILEKLGGRV